MHDSAPTRIATADVWTAHDGVPPWQSETSGDAVVLVSVTESEAALDEFLSEHDEFPSEADDRFDASSAGAMEFASEGGNLDDLFTAEQPATTVGIVAPVARAAAPELPKEWDAVIVPRRLPEASLRVEPSSAIAVAAPQGISSVRPPQTYRRAIGVGAAAALVVVSAMTIDPSWVSRSYSETATPEPTAPPLDAARPTVTEPAATLPSPDAGALDSASVPVEGPITVPSRVPPEPLRAAAVSKANDRPSGACAIRIVAYDGEAGALESAGRAAQRVCDPSSARCEPSATNCRGANRANGAVVARARARRGSRIVRTRIDVGSDDACSNRRARP